MGLTPPFTNTSIATPTPPKIAGATHPLVEYWYTPKERANEVAAEINRDSLNDSCAEVWQDGALFWDPINQKKATYFFVKFAGTHTVKPHPWTPKEQLRFEHACRDHQTEGKRLPSHTP